MTNRGVAALRFGLPRSRWIGALGLLAIGLFAACSYKVRTGVPARYDQWEHLTDWPVPKQPLDPVLKMLIWRDYFDPRILTFFEQRYHVKLQITFFENNAELKQVFKARPDEFDLLMPSDYVVQRYVRQGNLLAPLEKENIPNMGHIQQVLFRSPYDPELVYSVPMFQSCLGITFNFRKLQHIPRNFTLRGSSPDEDLLLFGYRALLDEPRVSLSAALLDDGADPNAPTQEQLVSAADRLIKDTKTLGIKFMASALPEKLINDEIMLAVNWSGAAAVAVRQNHDIRFVLPQSKKFIQVDSFVIPLTSKRRYTAEFFLNFLLIPEISGANTNFSLYANSNADSSPFIARDILLGPAYMEPPHTQRIFFADLGAVEDEFERQWNRVKESSPPNKAKVPSLLKEEQDRMMKSDLTH